jgi:hypothetical protein
MSFWGPNTDVGVAAGPFPSRLRACPLNPENEFSGKVKRTSQRYSREVPELVTTPLLLERRKPYRLPPFFRETIWLESAGDFLWGPPQVEPRRG